jgi:hypothetical protein
LDIPEEDPAELAASSSPEISQDQGYSPVGDANVIQNHDQGQTDDWEEVGDLDGLTTASQSKYHSRHVSRLSGPLSLPDAGGPTNNDPDDEGDMVPLRSPVYNRYIDDLDQDAVGEWTGSEDLYMENGSSDEVRMPQASLALAY